ALSGRSAAFPFTIPTTGSACQTTFGRVMDGSIRETVLKVTMAILPLSLGKADYESGSLFRYINLTRNVQKSIDCRRPRKRQYLGAKDPRSIGYRWGQICLLL